MLHLTYDWIPGGNAPVRVPWMLWFRGYAGGVWSGTPSAGDSGNREIDFSVEPTVAALNGRGVAVFDGGSTNGLLDSNDSSPIVNMGPDYTIIIVAMSLNTTHDDAGPGNNPSLWSTTSGGWDISHTRDRGLTTYVNDGSPKNVAYAAAAGSYQSWQVRRRASVIEARTGGASVWAQAACGPFSNNTSGDRIGCNFSASQFFHGNAAEIMVTPVAMTDLEINTVVRPYLRARYKIGTL